MPLTAVVFQGISYAAAAKNAVAEVKTYNAHYEKLSNEKMMAMALSTSIADKNATCFILYDNTAKNMSAKSFRMYCRL